MHAQFMQPVSHSGPHKGKDYLLRTSRAAEQRGCFMGSTDGFLEAVNALQRQMLREQHSSLLKGKKVGSCVLNEKTSK